MITCAFGHTITGWRRCRGCHILIGHFPQKSSTICGLFNGKRPAIQGALSSLPCLGSSAHHWVAKMDGRPYLYRSSDVDKACKDKVSHPSLPLSDEQRTSDALSTSSQSGKDRWETLSLQVFSPQKICVMSGGLRKEMCNLKHPMHLRHLWQGLLHFPTKVGVIFCF